MFVATEGSEDPMLSALDLGALNYRGIELSVRLPWYIVTCKVRDGDLQFLRSFCCSWDLDLAELLRPQEGKTVASIQRMSPASDDYGWGVAKVTRVWQATGSPGDEGLVIEDEHGIDSWDGAFARGAWSADRWPLLFEAEHAMSVEITT